jgi:hypothetical protein
MPAILQAVVAGSEKQPEQFDRPKSSRVPTFNGCPIPSDSVIVNVICQNMKNEPYPFGLGTKRLLFSERADEAQPIVLGTRTLDYSSPIHIFAKSDHVKNLLELDIAANRGTDSRVHPTAIELRAAIYSINFFESVAAEHNGRWGTPRIIEHDNWQRMFWAFIRLFESGTGFVARWEDRYTYMSDLWDSEPKYSVSELCVTSLVDDCGKLYSLHNGEPLLEYVAKM